MPEGAGKSLPFQLLASIKKNKELNKNYGIGGITIVVTAKIV